MKKILFGFTVVIFFAWCFVGVVVMVGLLAGALTWAPFTCVAFIPWIAVFVAVLWAIGDIMLDA